jgi:N-acetylglucosamine kinase-like BadF-type ATPase
MILIADSGSSKTDWRLIDNNGEISQFRGAGFNPNYQAGEELSNILQAYFFESIYDRVEKVYFYGSGCASPQNRELVTIVLHKAFIKSTVIVEHDLLAAARATCGDQPGIACILGTGSNSCDYDGEHILFTRPSPGYILGDEGSGAIIGRKFLLDFIHEEIPNALRSRFIERYQLDNQSIIESVYKKPFPSRFMASFSEFLSNNKNDPYCYVLFYSSFKEFFKKHILKYDNFKKKPVNFVGSIAFYNSDILRNVAFDADIHVNIIVESPIAGLALYHLDNQ